MSAHSKQNRRKKTAPAQKTPPQPENLASSQAPEQQARELVPPKKAAPPHDGTVRKSTLCLTAALCLLLGTCLGTLLPALRGVKELAASVQQILPQQAPLPPGRGADGGGQIRELEEAARKNPQDPHAWIQLGNQYFDDHKPREAIRAYERALAIKGDNPDVLTDMGIMYRQLGEFERAAENFTQAGRIHPRHEQSRFNLGVVLFFDLHRKDEARKAWRALLDINPEAKTPDGALLRTMLDELK
ncbi:MAG: tetratricopeptide repeat protein [Deltaproteobacteria bacterium]|jgi:cytochrome c-type biogenesis protein CcmH/NrfG|nr:tetratricopeptide repeat protein [Deltaproteobacteria bacterium]